MKEITDFLTICIWFGTVILCVVLVVTGILRWISHMRSSKLKIAAWIAFVVLCLIALFNNIDSVLELGNSETNGDVTNLFINISKITVKVLMLGVVVGSAVMLLFFVFYFMVVVIKTVCEHKKYNGALSKKLNDESKELRSVLKSSLVKFVITWGILAVFVILPLLMGNSDDQSMAETWKNGIEKIASFVGTDTGGYGNELAVQSISGEDESEPNNNSKEYCSGEKTSFYNALAGYILIFIVVLGVGVAAVKILYSIIDNTFTNGNEGSLLGEYSSSIGVLAVGVALLGTFQDKDFFSKSPLEMLGECVKSFSFVTVIVAVIILTLEIIRLLMDMRIKLIRQEGKYLFISLVGQASILLLVTINYVCDAVNNVIGSVTSSKTEQVQKEIQQKMIEAMREQLKEQRPEDKFVIFPAFSGKVTKK